MPETDRAAPVLRLAVTLTQPLTLFDLEKFVAQARALGMPDSSSVQVTTLPHELLVSAFLPQTRVPS